MGWGGGIGPDCKRRRLQSAALSRRTGRWPAYWHNGPGLAWPCTEDWGVAVKAENWGGGQAGGGRLP